MAFVVVGSVNVKVIPRRDAGGFKAGHLPQRIEDSKHNRQTNFANDDMGDGVLCRASMTVANR